MRGLFFIVKGHYEKGAEPSFMNSVSGSVTHIGGYDPHNKNTDEWYMVLDNKTFHCISCGGDFNKVLRSVYTIIKKNKGVAKRYFKHVSSITSDDYYETHYLGKRPLTHEQRAKKAEGRCPRISPAMRCLYENIYAEYGDYYREQIEEMEDLAYSELREDNPIHKSKKLMAKTKTPNIMIGITPKEEQHHEVTTPKKLAKPKVKLGVKKLSIG